MIPADAFEQFNEVIVGSVLMASSAAVSVEDGDVMLTCGPPAPQNLRQYTTYWLADM